MKNETCSEIGSWNVVVSSTTGASHDAQGKNCQDAYYWEIVSEDVLIVAVADGAGSASLGEVGSSVAVRAAVESVCLMKADIQKQADDAVFKNLLLQALESAKSSVEVEAETRKVGVKELATTLILVIATPASVAALQVGDGAAIFGDEAGNIIGLTKPEVGEFVNETTFLTSSRAIKDFQLNIWHGAIKNLVIFSDGLQRLALKMPEGIPHSPFISSLFQFVVESKDEEKAKEQLKYFLSSPKVRDETDDDITLFLATLLH